MHSLQHRGEAAIFLPPCCMRCAFDHVVVAARNVDKASKAFFQLTGVRPTFGGHHVNRGTKNYLVSLGGDKYLELVGLDEDQDYESLVEKNGVHSIPFGVYKLQPTQSEVVTFACATSSLHETARLSPWVGKPFSMSRETPSGDVLKWSLAFQSAKASATHSLAYPFFIDWESVNGQGLHPSITSAAGCRLISLVVEVSNPAQYKEALGQAGMGDNLDDGVVNIAASGNAFSKDRLTIIIDTPKGVVSISNGTLFRDGWESNNRG